MRKGLLLILLVLSVQFVTAAAGEGAEPTFISYPPTATPSTVYIKNLVIENTTISDTGNTPSVITYNISGTLVATDDFDSKVYLVKRFDDSLSVESVSIDGTALAEYQYIYKYIDLKMSKGDEKQISFSVNYKVASRENYLSLSVNFLPNTFVKNSAFIFHGPSTYYVSSTQNSCNIIHADAGDTVSCSDGETSGFDFYGDAYLVDDTQIPTVTHTELLKLDNNPTVYYVVELKTQKYFTDLTTKIQLGAHTVPYTKNTTYSETTLTVHAEKPTTEIRAILRQTVTSPFNFWRGDTQLVVAYAPDYDLEFEYTGTEMNQYESPYETGLMETAVSDVLPADYILQGYYKGAGDAKFKLDNVGTSEHLATVVQSADLEAFPTTRGFAVMKASYIVINTENGKVMEITMPSNAEVWAVMIDGKTRPILMQGNVLKMPLPTSEAYGGCSRDYYTGAIASCNPTPGNFQPINVSILYAVSDFFKPNPLGAGFSYATPTLKDTIISQANIKIAIPGEFTVMSLSSNPEINALRTQERTISGDQPYPTALREIDMTVQGAMNDEKTIANAVDAFDVENPTAVVQEVKLTYRGVPVVLEIPAYDHFVYGSANLLQGGETVTINVGLSRWWISPAIGLLIGLMFLGGLIYFAVYRKGFMHKKIVPKKTKKTSKLVKSKK